MHGEIRAERVRSRIGDAESFEKLLHFPVLAVVAVEPDEHEVELAEHANRKTILEQDVRLAYKKMKGG